MSNWFQGNPSIEDGYYWRKEINDSTPAILGYVGNGAMADMSIDDEGTTYLEPNFDLQDYIFSGPLECPPDNKEHWDCVGF